MSLKFYGSLLSPALLLTGCAAPAAAPAVPEAQPAMTPPAAEAPLPPHVNEAGRIPVLMYHRIAASDSVYDRTAEAFAADLERLYAEGYRPISLKDFVAGRIDVPAGFSPVVLTFDDGDPSQYRAVEGGPEPTADCALGIMEAFREKHPDFNPQATFFVNGGGRFGQGARQAEKLAYLVSRGYTIGNHSWGHEKLSTLTPAEIMATLGRNASDLEGLTGEPVTLLALPYGIRPKEADPMAATVSGSWEGKPYRNSGILNVGWQPELPAYISGFDPLAINRIRCGEGEGEAWDWLSRLTPESGQRFISDGDPDTVTVPAAMAGKVSQEALQGKTLRISD